ncbi:HAUS augmin-like complex subunit 2 [Porphyrio hochstetteri]
MAAARSRGRRVAAAASGLPKMAEYSLPDLLLMAAATPETCKPAGPARRTQRLNYHRGATGGEERSGAEEERGAAAAGLSWEGEHPTAAAALLARCMAEGIVSQETLDLTRKKDPCFLKFSEVERMADIQAEINEKKMKIEILQLEKETADIAHPFYLGEKYKILQDMNEHLEAVLKEKRALRKRLLKPRCQDSLPIEATYHKCVIQLLTEAVTFIEKLESHLQTIRSIPQIPTVMKNMDTALSKTQLLVMELEELTEAILKWREVQKAVYSDSICNTAEFDFGLSLT